MVFADRQTDLFFWITTVLKLISVNKVQIYLSLTVEENICCRACSNLLAVLLESPPFTKTPPRSYKNIHAQLSMKFFWLINVKMPTVVGILTLLSRKNSIQGFFELDKN